MITATYFMSGALLAIAGYLFSIGVLSAQTQTIAWMVIFFFASPAASAAYLTVSETFPLEIRALAIAMFYAVGTGDRRRRRSGAVRRADRYRVARERVRRISLRRGADDRRVGSRMAALHRLRTHSRSSMSRGRWLR